jgi:hypothetical protein
MYVASMHRGRDGVTTCHLPLEGVEAISREFLLEDARVTLGKPAQHSMAWHGMP